LNHCLSSSVVLIVLQVFIWKVPENFTLYTDAEEPADVGPVKQLTGHAR